MGARCSNGAELRRRIGWSCRKCSAVSSKPLSSPGARGRRPRARSPTAMLGQPKYRASAASPKTRTLLIGAAAWSLRSSLQRSTQKKRRRAQRRKRLSVKRACSDTIEDSPSSASEADARKKRARYYKESSPRSHIHVQAGVSHDPHRSSLGLLPFCDLAHGGYVG